MTTENEAVEKTPVWYQSASDLLSDVSTELDKKSRAYAEYLHETGYVYALFGAVDGLNLSYSTLKYCFDVLYTNSDISSTDAMHEWTLTPAGIAVAATESIALIVFAMMANSFDDKDSNKFKRYIALSWPYVRDVLKATKNAYKGSRTFFQVINLIGGQALNLNFLILPVGLTLGVIASLNRIWYRDMVAERKQMMDNNDEQLKKVRAEKSLTAEQAADIRNKLLRQKYPKRAAAYLSAAYSGFVDSLYLYIGVLSLCSLAPPALIAMSVFCVIYSVCCIATRLYDEYMYQNKLLITVARVELESYYKEHKEDWESALEELEKILILLAENNLKESERQKLDERKEELAKNLLEGSLKDLVQKRNDLQSLQALSNISAILLGIKNGLYAYAALSSVMFAVATILLLASTSFPPAFLITCVSIGMALIIGFVVHSLIKHASHRATLKNNDPYTRLEQLFTELKNPQFQEKISDNISEAKVSIGNHLVLDPTPQFFFQEWFEIVRCFFSGLGKGTKAVDYTLNPLQEMGDNGHYSDTSIMVVLGLCTSVVCAVALALRSYAKGFGRTQPSLDAVAPEKSVMVDEVVESVSPPPRRAQIGRSTFYTKLSFFPPPPSENTMSPSNSESNLLRA